jgi:hypothetical protein
MAADIGDIDSVLAEHYFTTAMDSVRDLIDHGVDGNGTASHYAPTVETYPDVEYSDHDVKRYIGVLHNVHSATVCRGQSCTIHRPSPHHMRTWPIVWRDTAQRFDRICVCGVGHPDPDQIEYWSTRGNLIWRLVHSCDGCCCI